MNREYQILILEDNADDARLIEHELSRGGIIFSSRRVETKENFLEELRNFDADVILADYSLSSFDGLSALEIARELCPDVPVVIISGSISEAMAFESIKRGASDYIFKYRISRLAPSVSRVLREARERAEYKRIAEASILKEEEHLKRLSELERFYDMAIGRELRMLELKEEMKSLKEELAKHKTMNNVSN
jgi:DNA-binding NtrC family response regulator